MIPESRKMEFSRAIEIIKNNNCGILSTSSLDAIPYGCAILKTIQRFHYLF